MTNHDDLLARADEAAKTRSNAGQESVMYLLADLAAAIRFLQARLEYEQTERGKAVVAMLEVAAQLEAEHRKNEMTRLNNALFVEQWERLCTILGIEKRCVIEVIDTAERRLAEVEQDARRYRWLRDQNKHTHYGYSRNPGKTPLEKLLMAIHGDPRYFECITSEIPLAHVPEGGEPICKGG